MSVTLFWRWTILPGIGAATLPYWPTGYVADSAYASVDQPAPLSHALPTAPAICASSDHSTLARISGAHQVIFLAIAFSNTS